MLDTHSLLKRGRGGVAKVVFAMAWRGAYRLALPPHPHLFPVNQSILSSLGCAFPWGDKGWECKLRKEGVFVLWYVTSSGLFTHYARLEK